MSKSRSPGRQRSHTPDRFIPKRPTQDELDASHELVMSALRGRQQEEDCLSPKSKEYSEKMGINLATVNGRPDGSKVILRYTEKAPLKQVNSAQVLYKAAPLNSVKRTQVSRHIPLSAERVLDAPDLLDDFYLNLVDWSSQNHLAIALGGVVYIWNAGDGSIHQLVDLPGEDLVTSVSWIADGRYLAIGTDSCEVQLWDIAQSKRIRQMLGHSSRVGSLCWNQHMLSSGCRRGPIFHHDVRIAQHKVGALVGHTQEVCGLHWSPDGAMLASGGNDNCLFLWPQASASTGSSHPPAPLYRLTEHTAAVKALAWCPFQRHCLASGGGTADAHIRIWSADSGQQVSCINTKSQVCGLLWNSHYRELVSGHGFAENQLTIWKYPKLEKVADLTGHTERVLHMSLSPDSSTVVSAAADETLRLWKCWEVDPAVLKKAHAAGVAKGSSGKRREAVTNVYMR